MQRKPIPDLSRELAFDVTQEIDFTLLEQSPAYAETTLTQVDFDALERELAALRPKPKKA